MSGWKAMHKATQSAPTPEEMREHIDEMVRQERERPHARPVLLVSTSGNVLEVVWV